MNTRLPSMMNRRYFRTAQEPTDFQYRTSTRISDQHRWRHHEHSLTPSLTYQFRRAVPEKYTHFSEEEQHSIFGTRNWSVDDPRIQDNIKEIQTYLEEWWNMKYNECDRDQDLEDGLSATNRVIWEHELYQALLQAARTVEERWQQKFHKEFENRFNDDLVKFLRKGRSKKS